MIMANTILNEDTDDICFVNISILKLNNFYQVQKGHVTNSEIVIYSHDIKIISLLFVRYLKDFELLNVIKKSL